MLPVIVKTKKAFRCLEDLLSKLGQESLDQLLEALPF